MTMVCSKCNLAKGDNDFYIRRNRGNQPYRYCKSCHAEKQQNRRQRKRSTLIEEAGGCCEICKYRRCQAALTFHHKNPDEKAFQISKAEVDKHSMDELRVEASKCALICANCHAEIHSG